MAAGGRGGLGSSKEGPRVAQGRGDGVVQQTGGGGLVSEQTSERTSRIAAALQVGASCQEGLSADSPVAFG